MDWATFRGIQSSWKGMEYFERPQDKPYAENREVVQGACEWGTICNASAGMGRVVAEAHGVSPWSIFVRPGSDIRTPEDLADIPIAVGMRAGSHFNVPYRLEKYLPLDRIKCENIGGFGARLEALLSGEVAASSLLPPQIDMAKQLGLREIIADEFRTLWWVPAATPPAAVSGYLRALDRAERALRADLPRYLPLWRHSVPSEFQDRDWDFGRFSRGERFVFEDFPREDFDENLRPGKALGPCPACRGNRLRRAGLQRAGLSPRPHTAAIVWTSIRNGSCTSRSTSSSVFGGYLPSGNILGNSRSRKVMNSGIDCEWTI